MDVLLLDSSDLNRYSDPYLFSLLNTFEQILFAAKLKDDALSKATLRTIEESAALIPRNPANDDRIFAGSKYRNRVDLVSCSDGKQEEVAEVKEAEEVEVKDPDNPMADDQEQEVAAEDEYNPFAFDDTHNLKNRDITILQEM